MTGLERESAKLTTKTETFILAGWGKILFEMQNEVRPRTRRRETSTEALRVLRRRKKIKAQDLFVGLE